MIPSYPTGYDRWLAGVEPADIPDYLALLLVGSAGSGKTTWSRRIRVGNFVEQRVPTQGVDVETTVLRVTSRGVEKEVPAMLYDCSGDKMWSSTIRTIMEQRVDCALVFTDGTRSDDADDVRNWVHKCEARGLPTIVCASRQDLHTNTQDANRGATKQCFGLLQDLMWLRDQHGNLPSPARLCMALSSRSNYQLSDPLLWALRKKTGDKDLTIG